MFRRFALAELNSGAYRAFHKILSGHAAVWKEARKAFYQERKGLPAKTIPRDIPISQVQEERRIPRLLGNTAPAKVASVSDLPPSNTNTAKETGPGEGNQPQLSENRQSRSSLQQELPTAEDARQLAGDIGKDSQQDEISTSEAPGTISNSKNSTDVDHSVENLPCLSRDHLRPHLVIKRTISMKELAGIFCHARQKGHLTDTSQSWILLPSTDTRGLSDGYTPSTPVFNDQIIEGLRMVLIPNLDSNGKFICVYGCQRGGTHFHLGSDEYTPFSNLTNVLSRQVTHISLEPRNIRIPSEGRCKKVPHCFSDIDADKFISPINLAVAGGLDIYYRQIVYVYGN